MIRRETALITAWRIDRYAGGLRNKAFFANVPPDMPEAQQKAWEALHKRRSWSTRPPSRASCSCR